MTAPEQLHWDEPDAGCVSCGQPYLTIDDHRCGSCLGLDLVHCPHCLKSIADIVDREIARRWRDTSNDVNAEMRVRHVFDRIAAAVQAEIAVRPTGAALRRDKLRERIYGEEVPA